MNIVLLGAPGAGKGTQSEMLVEEGLCHISTGDILRSAVKNETELGKKAKGYMDAGNLVPDELIIDLMRERMSEPDTEKGVILDGFPRTTTQAVALDTMLADMGRPLDAALLIDVDAEVIVKRLTSRRMCKECGAIGSVSDGDKCKKCGGEMYQRDDDNEDTVRNRLEVYENSTSPLIEYYRGKELLVSVDGDRAPEEVYADVKKSLGL